MLPLPGSSNSLSPPDIRQAVSDHVRRLDADSLDALLSQNRSFDLNGYFFAKQCKLLDDFNFAGDWALLDQKLYCFCFDRLDEPDQWQKIPAMMRLLRRHGFRSCRRFFKLKEGDGVDLECFGDHGIWYALFRKLARLIESYCDVHRGVLREMYAELYHYFLNPANACVSYVGRLMRERESRRTEEDPLADAEYQDICSQLHGQFTDHIRSRKEDRWRWEEGCGKQCEHLLLVLEQAFVDFFVLWSAANDYLMLAELQKCLWRIVMFVAVELWGCDAAHLHYRRARREDPNFYMSAPDMSVRMVGPVFDEGEVMNQVIPVAYPAVWPAMMSGDIEMMKMLQEKCGALLDEAAIRRHGILLLCKFYAKRHPVEVYDYFESSCKDSEIASYAVSAAKLLTGAEQGDCSLVKSILSAMSQSDRARLAQEFVPGAIVPRPKIRTGNRSCELLIGEPRFLNERSLPLIALTSGNLELLKTLMQEMPLYSPASRLSNTGRLFLLSTVAYSTVRKLIASDEDEDKHFLSYLMHPPEKGGIGDHVAPLVLFYAAHRNDSTIISELVSEFKGGIFHMKPDGGMTAYQLAINFEPCSPEHKVQVRKRLQGGGDDSGDFSTSTVATPTDTKKQKKTFEELMELSPMELQSTLGDSDDYLKVDYRQRMQNPLLALVRSSAEPDLEKFGILKEYLLRTDSTGFEESAADILTCVVEHAHPRHLRVILEDQDVLRIMRPKATLRILQYVFFERLQSQADSEGDDVRLEHCIDPLLAFYSDDVALTGGDETSMLLDCLELARPASWKKCGNLHGVGLLQERLLDKLLRFCRERDDWIPVVAQRFARCSDAWMPGIRTILDYMRERDATLLASGNALGMNLLMHCIDSELRASEHIATEVIEYMLDSGVFDVNAVARVDEGTIPLFDQQHVLGIPKSSNKDTNTVIQSVPGQAHKFKRVEGIGISDRFKDQQVYMSVDKLTITDESSTEPRASRIVAMGKVNRDDGTPMPTDCTSESHEAISDISEAASSLDASADEDARVELGLQEMTLEDKVDGFFNSSPQEQQRTAYPEYTGTLQLAHLDSKSIVTDQSGFLKGEVRLKFAATATKYFVDDTGHLSVLKTENYVVDATALTLAIVGCKWGVVSRLLDHEGIDVRHRGGRNASPLALILLSTSLNEETMERLVEKLLKKVDKGYLKREKVAGKTALQLAIDRKQISNDQKQMSKIIQMIKDVPPARP